MLNRNSLNRREMLHLSLDTGAAAVFVHFPGSCRFYSAVELHLCVRMKTMTEYKPASALMSLTCAFLCLVQMRSCSWTALRSVLLTSPRSSGGSLLSFQVTLLLISLYLSLFSHLWDRNGQTVDRNTQVIIIIIMAHLNSELVAYVHDAPEWCFLKL